MRIGLNTLALVPGASGGDGTYIRELVGHLAHLDHDNTYVLFVAPWNRHLFAALPPNFEPTLCPIRPGSLPARVWWEQSALPRFLERAGLDLFHAPVNVAPLRVRVPLVLTLLEAEPFMSGTRMPRLARLYWRVFRRASARKALRIIAVSESGAREIVRYMGVPAEKIEVVHLGVDPHRFETGTPPAAPPVDYPYILWVGQSFPRKNLLRLIEAYSKLRLESDLPHKLLLLGVQQWGHREALGAIRRAGLPDHIVLGGWVADEELPAYYRHASVFVCPSLHEGFGLTVLEAMASGAPVIASNRAALPEIVGDAGLLVDPFSVEAIRDALRRVLADPVLRNDLVARGRRRAASFAWGETARRTRALYEQVGQPGGRGRS